jgi:hypothetical protein
MRFPEPSLLRLGHGTVPQAAKFTSIGSHIIATYYNVTVTFDINTAKLVRSNRQGMIYDTAIAVGDSLYVLESFSGNYISHSFCFSGGLHCLTKDPYNVEMPWAWQPLSDSSPFCWSWTDRPPTLPFDAKKITGHAVHPRMGTIFMSTTLRNFSWNPPPYDGSPHHELKGEGTFLYATRGAATGSTVVIGCCHSKALRTMMLLVPFYMPPRVSETCSRNGK